MTTSSISNRAQMFKWLLTVAPLLTSIGCGTDFDSPDKVKTLRVLAIQKDHPYAAPSDDPPANPNLVNMTMLSHDSVTDRKDPKIQRLWFSGCDDLPGDQYFTGMVRIYYLWQMFTSAGHPSIDDLAQRKFQGKEWWSPVDDIPAETPPGDQLAIWQPLMQQVNPQLAAQLAAETDSQKQVDLARAYFDSYRVGAGERFAYSIPPRIIENHPPSQDPAIKPYGVSFVFFTACAGHIEVAPDWQNADFGPGSKLENATLGFPFQCLDNTTGKALGPDDYVAGYTQQFVYGDGSANLNPTIRGVDFNGGSVDSKFFCKDGDCVPEPPLNACEPAEVPAASDGSDAGDAPDAGDAGVEPQPHQTAPEPPHVPACKSHCPKYGINPTLIENDPGNDQTDPLREGSAENKQMWIDYYSDRGTINHAAKSLRDAALGWFPDNGSTWTPPSDPGPVNIWAVVHDNRGGTSWVRLQICVE